MELFAVHFREIPLNKTKENKRKQNKKRGGLFKKHLEFLEVFRAIVCLSFNDRTLSCSDKTAIIAASTLQLPFLRA